MNYRFGPGFEGDLPMARDETLQPPLVVSLPEAQAMLRDPNNAATRSVLRCTAGDQVLFDYGAEKDEPHARTGRVVDGSGMVRPWMMSVEVPSIVERQSDRHNAATVTVWTRLFDWQRPAIGKAA